MWYVAYREDALNEKGEIVRVRRNKPICETKGVSKREAQRKADEEILNTINAQALQPSSMLTLKQFVESRFRPEVVKYRKHAGKLHYDYVLDTHVLPAIGEKRLRDITHDDVQGLIGLKHDAGLSPQTLVHIRNVITRIFKHAKSKKAFHGDLPTQELEMPEMVRKEKHAMTFDQAMALLRALKEFSLIAYAIVLLSLTTSMNIAEMLGLRRKRVNLLKDPIVIDGRLVDGETIAVRQNFYRGEFGTVKAKGRVRDLPMSDELVKTMQRIINESKFSGEDDLVFSTDKGTPLDEKNLMRLVIKPVAVGLKMPWMGWHVLRHTYSTLSDRLGMSLADRQAQMGHDDFRMTLHYTHADVERRRKNVNQLSELLVGDSPEMLSNVALNGTRSPGEIPVSC